jgi:hypothetical protein
MSNKVYGTSKEAMRESSTTGKVCRVEATRDNWVELVELCSDRWLASDGSHYFALSDRWTVFMDKRP